TSAFGYAGQYTDTEAGLQWDRARYYDPTTAQFLTVDPLAATTGTRYNYALGNPITGADPTGLWGWNPLDWTAGDWETVGLVAGGVALAATGVRLFVDAGVISLGVASSVTLEWVGAGAGVVAVATDAVPCVSSLRDSTQKPNVGACIGAAFGALSLGAGSVPESTFGKLSAITFGTTAGLEDAKNHAENENRSKPIGVGCW
ncbi:MAG: RHS repeat-associated core domain-containing protein, partial [Propionibacterium sp.]|nr:RHS repeat-associated core domain-containing protein [Propionibacterium sp.]